MGYDARKSSILLGLDTFSERGRRWDRAHMEPDFMGLGLARILRDESAEPDGPGAWGRVKSRGLGALGWSGWCSDLAYLGPI